MWQEHSLKHGYINREEHWRANSWEVSNLHRVCYQTPGKIKSTNHHPPDVQIVLPHLSYSNNIVGLWQHMVLKMLLLVSLAICICMHTVKGVFPCINSGAATGPPQPLESLLLQLFCKGGTSNTHLNLSREVLRNLYEEKYMKLSPLILLGFNMSSLLMQVMLLPWVHMYTIQITVNY